MIKLDRQAERMAALGHPARLAVLRSVVQAGPRGMTTTALQKRLKIPWTTLNHHLDRLVESGLVKARREGRLALHTAEFETLKELTDFLWEDCCRSGREDTGCCRE